MSLRKCWFAIGTGLTVLTTGCGGGGATGPATLSSPATTAAKLDTVTQALSTPQFQSFSALAAKFTPTASASAMRKVAALVEATRPELPSARELSYVRSARRAEALRQAFPLRTNASTASIFPLTVVGKTYVWSTSTNSYVASGRTGAPTNGVRFILYAVDPLTDLPSSPLTEIGYADLTDKSSGSTVSLGITVVGTSGPSPVTYVDYTISGTFTSASQTATVAGYVTDSKTRVDFSVSISASESASSATVTFNSTVDVAAKSIHIVFKVTLNSSSTSSSTTLTFTPDFTLTIGTETVTATGTVTVTVTQTGETVSGTITVKVNGGDFATIAISTTGTPTPTCASGRQCTQDEKNALEKIFDVPTEILTGIEELFKPGELIFGFSVPT